MSTRLKILLLIFFYLLLFAGGFAIGKLTVPKPLPLPTAQQKTAITTYYGNDQDNPRPTQAATAFRGSEFNNTAQTIQLEGLSLTIPKEYEDRGIKVEVTEAPTTNTDEPECISPIYRIKATDNAGDLMKGLPYPYINLIIDKSASEFEGIEEGGFGILVDGDQYSLGWVESINDISGSSYLYDGVLTDTGRFCLGINSGESIVTKEFPTSEWVAFESEELGFSLKYPPNWKLDTVLEEWEEENPDFYISILGDTQGAHPELETQLFDGAYLTAGKPKVIEGDFDNWIKEKYPESTDEGESNKITKLTLGSHSYTQVHSCGIMCCFDNYYTLFGNKVYSFSSQAVGSDSDLFSRTIRKILATLVPDE